MKELNHLNVILFCITIHITMIQLFVVYNDPWIRHKKKFSLSFDIDEDNQRRNIFQQNLQYINKINAANLSYKLEMNHLGHLTINELLNGINKDGLKARSMKNINKKFDLYGMYIPKLYNNKDYIDGIDWRKFGVATKIKNQGRCGSCWAFSAIGAIEAALKIKYNKTQYLSEQQLVDCDTELVNHGCDGGIPVSAYEYSREFGLVAEDDYKYTAHDDQCKLNSYTRKNYNFTKIKGYSVLAIDEFELSRALVDVGPISVAIDAGSLSFQFYKSGVYYNPNCNSDVESLNHAVLAVGYGFDFKTKQSYYIVKNSWGLNWGDNGYIKMIRNVNNNCGIASFASYPTV